MTDYLLKVANREEHGKGATRRLRLEGKIPGVVYGTAKSEEHIAIDAREAQRLLGAGAFGKLVSLHLNGGQGAKVPVLFKDYQVEPLKGNLQHIDFQRVDMLQPITTKVAVHLTGEDQRPNDGAMIQPVLREIEVTCLPDHIPEAFVVDISGLEVGHSIQVNALQPGEGVAVNTGPDEIVVMAVAQNRAAETEAPAEPATETETPAAEGE